MALSRLTVVIALFLLTLTYGMMACSSGDSNSNQVSGTNLKPEEIVLDYLAAQESKDFDKIASLQIRPFREQSDFYYLGDSCNEGEIKFSSIEIESVVFKPNDKVEVSVNYDFKGTCIETEELHQDDTFFLRQVDGDWYIDGWLTRDQMCLSEDTMIDTPDGWIAVKDIQQGMIVWTIDNAGLRQSAIVQKTSSVYVRSDHEMVHLQLNDGREVFASPGHPMADGRVIGNLIVGDAVDDAHVISVEIIPYDAAKTYDILPSDDTGIYWANGIPMGSTIAPRAN